MNNKHVSLMRRNNMSIRKAKKQWKKWMLSQGFKIRYCQPSGLGDDFGFLYSISDVRVIK